MADYAPAHAATEAPDDGSVKAQPNELVTRYWREIERYDRVTDSWRQTGRRITRKYRDEDRAQQGQEKANTSRRFALLWSNVETLKPAVYAKVPVAVVSRRWKDEDPIGRIGAELLERAANCLADLYGYDETFRMVRDDRLLPARGQAWVRYEASFEDVPANGVEGEDGYEAGYEKLAGEKVCLDHVHWCDFGHNVARVWADVWLVWRKVYKTRSEVRERFGREVAAALNYNVRPPEDDGKQESGEHKACLYEVWDKRRKKTCFLGKEYQDLIEDDDPPLQLHGFFPCPEPAYGTKTADSLIPRPDYCYYQDQAEEIDDLTAKIGELTDWLIVKGFIPGGPSSDGADAIERLLREKGKSILVPIESWQGWTERGGARQIDWLPLDIIIQALQAAIEARQQLVQDVFQITGIADILRGQTDPNETLGAQQLKAQTGSRRVRNTKDEIARFARDVYRLVCEVIAEQFRPETLAAMTGYKYVPGQVVGMPQRPAPPPPGMPPQPPMPMGQPVPGTPGAPALPAQGGATPQMPPQMPVDAPDEGGDMVFDDQVIQRLRDDRVRSYSIDVETDSTVQPDEDAEKQRRVEFATMFGGMLKEITALFQVGPVAAPLAPAIAEGMKFVVRGFRAGRALEDAIDRSLDKLLQQIKAIASQPPKPSPEEMKAKVESDKAKADMQAKQMDAQIKQHQAQQDAQVAQQKAQLEIAQAQQQIQLEREKHQMDMQFAAQKHQMEMAFKQREMEQKIAMDQQAAQNKMVADSQQHEMQMAQQNEKAAAQPNSEGTA